MGTKDRLFEITVQIGGHRQEREESIVKACMVEWAFREEDFLRCPSEDGTTQLIQVSALGMVLAGEDVQEIVGRLERAVWRANGRMCHVNVETMALDKAPSPFSSADEDEYQREIA